MRGSRAIVAALVLLPWPPSAARAQEFPVAAPGTEGFAVIVASADPVEATCLGFEAALTSEVFLALDSLGTPGDDGDVGNDLFILNNHGTPIGSTVRLGTFAPDTALIFRLSAVGVGPGYTFLTGPAARNPDRRPHARAEGNYGSNTSLVSFEDLRAGEANDDYSNLSFSVTNTIGITLVPEPATFGLLGAGVLALGGVGAWRRAGWRTAGVPPAPRTLRGPAPTA